MTNNIMIIIKYVTDKKKIELYSKRQYFDEQVIYMDFKDEVEKLLDEINPSFKVKRILVFDEACNDYFDSDNTNLFQNMQKFQIICEVNVKIKLLLFEF
jgi:hypothetical protein